MEFSYISGSRNPKNFLIFQEVTFHPLKKCLVFREMKKSSCTLGLLLHLFAERGLFKHKREINFLSLLAALFACRSISRFKLKEQLLVFLLF